MGMTVLKKKTGYALGLLLSAFGVLLLLVTLWKWWDIGVLTSPDIMLAVSESLWAEYPEIAFGVGLMIVHYVTVGVVFLIVGVVILVIRREKIRVAEEVAVTLSCPYCKNQWREHISKAQLEHMGYPKVRTLSRRKCSKCAKFIRPKIVTVDK
ncbi:hypothetical protein E3J51_02500 [Candidatus Bathyarchaeota archaeon]|nr:MAG: hypothetical protein E3J51_02500 [Candidatus Bathyarchaeota archaeon]